MAQLSIYRKGQLEGVFYLPKQPVVIGRADGVEIQLLDSRVSRRHAIIRESVAGYMIQDMNTKNGTFVNKESVDKSLLFHGDAVIIGAYTLTFLEQDEDVQSLNSEFVSTVHSGALRIPQGLRDPGSANARASTVNEGAGSPPARVTRLDRQRAAGWDDSKSNVPLIEGLAPEEDGAGGDLGIDLSSFDFDI